LINEELNKWAKTFRVRRESDGGGNQPAPRKTAIGFTKTGGGVINVGRTIDFEIDQKAIIAKI
jgi:hypothetical protein